MSRPAPSCSGLAAALTAAVLAFTLVPTASAVAGTLADDDRSYCERMGHTMPDETPSDDAPADASTCCVSTPEAPRDAVVHAPTSVPEITAAVITVLASPVATASAPPPRDTGPPPGPRLHLAHSVFLV